MANSWLRLWHDMPNDPKWRTIARVSGQPIALVQAVYLQLLVSASQNSVTDVTGVTLHIVTVTNEDVASALDVTERNIDSVTEAMQGRVLDGKTITGWDKRQSSSHSRKNGGRMPLTGAERAKRYRDRKRGNDEEERNVTQSNVTVTANNDVTPQIRKEEIRKELKDQNTLSDSGEPPSRTSGIGDTDPIETAFEDIFWGAGLRRDAKTKARSAFRTKYGAWKKINHGPPDDFARLLAKDIRLRLQAQVFGFDKLLPSTYLNCERWNDEKPARGRFLTEPAVDYSEIPAGFRGG